MQEQTPGLAFHEDRGLLHARDNQPTGAGPSSRPARTLMPNRLVTALRSYSALRSALALHLCSGLLAYADNPAAREYDDTQRVQSLHAKGASPLTDADRSTLTGHTKLPRGNWEDLTSL
jgi:hypothetical protein